MPYHVVSHDIMLHHVMPYHVMSHHVMPQHDTHLLGYLEAVKRLQSEHVSVPVYRPEGHLEHGGEHVEGVFRIQDLSLQSQPREE